MDETFSLTRAHEVWLSCPLKSWATDFRMILFERALKSVIIYIFYTFSTSLIVLNHDISV